MREILNRLRQIHLTTILGPIRSSNDDQEIRSRERIVTRLTRRLQDDRIKIHRGIGREREILIRVSQILPFRGSNADQKIRSHERRDRTNWTENVSKRLDKDRDRERDIE